MRDTANTEAIIVEYGFIDNQEDLDNITKYMNEYVDAVVDAVVDYKNINIPIDYYVVKSGDTLYGISKMYNISVSKLMEMNNLKSTLLKINQKLIVPSSTLYKVKSGDTLYSIAKKYNVTVDSIKNKNNLKSNLISINQLLKI